MNKSTFTPKRVTRTYRQTINATPEKVFPLLCPVREAEWLDGWRYNMIYSESGFAEEGAVFSTPFEGEVDTVWIITKHDPINHKIEFARFTPSSKTCLLRVAVKSKDRDTSYVNISYTYTAIRPAGNGFIDNFTKETFLKAVTFWEQAMNYFLETGMKFKKAQ